MSMCVKVVGKLVFENARELEAAAFYVDEEDDYSQEVQDLIDEGVQAKKM